MHYFSTNRRSPYANFREAVLAGQPDDRGLFFPSEIPRHDVNFFNGLDDLSTGDLAFQVMKPYIMGEITDDELARICHETVNFEIPLVRLTDEISALELFHGPTLAFKDVGARFMSRCLGYFSRAFSEKTVVVVATSGDTGGAVAAGFHNVDGVEVVILFPKGRVSKVQEMQLTRLGGNVTTLELHGSFDDCQAIAKQLLADEALRGKAKLTSANSINIARWLPQQIYYFAAIAGWDGEPPIFCVPSGNFGNLAAGMLANASGLPVKRFIAACNANDVVPRYMETFKYRPRPSIATLSNAMDVGDPSNFVRILEIFGHDDAKLAEVFAAKSISDVETAATMREMYKQCNYIADPHGAVAFRVLRDNLDRATGEKGIFLETAHPVKFDSVADILGFESALPTSISELASRPSASIEVENDYEAVRDILVGKL